MSTLIIAATVGHFLTLNGFSHHFDDPPAYAPRAEWNEQNWGLGYEYQGEDVFGSLGALKDSNGNASYYAGLGPMWRVGKRFSYGVQAGVMSRVRYGLVPGSETRYTHTAAVATLLPRISYHGERGGASLFFLPSTGESGSALFLQFNLKLGD